MMFLAFVVGIAALALLGDRLGIASFPDWASRLRLGLAAALMFFGVDHSLSVGRYVPMIEGFVPFAEQVVLMTGACEIAGAIGLLVPATRRLAGIMLAIYFICVFPANIANAVNGLAVDGLPSSGWYYWVRLVFQPLYVWLALFAAGIVTQRQGPAALQPLPLRR